MNKEEQEKRYLELQQMYQDNLHIWEGEEFTGVKAKYDQAKKDYLKLIKEARARSVKTVISKGEMYNVFPFENEQYGNKLNGKVIQEVIMHNDCNIHYFDEQGRLILKENISDFLKKPAYFSLYYYTGNTVEYIYGSNSGIYRYEVFTLSDEGQFVRHMNYAKEGKGFGNYYYKDGRIVRSDTHHIEFRNKPLWDAFYQYEYIYDVKGKLQQIFCYYPYGGKDIKYSTKKVNYKNLEQRVFEEMKAGIGQFLQEHTGEKFTRFGIDCDSPHGLFLCMDTSNKPEFMESLADWEYTEITEVELVDFPLDDAQTEKLMTAIAKALQALVASSVFGTLLSDSAFKIVFLDHQGTAKEMYPGVGKLLRDGIYCY